MNILSPAVKIVGVFATGGAAFALANILLARHLSPAEFGLFTLVLSITTFGTFVGPISLDAAVLRHRPGPTIALLKNSLLSAIPTAFLFAGVSFIVYKVDASYLTIMGTAIAAGSVARVGASVFQSEERYAPSLWIIQSQNLTLIVAAILAGLFGAISTSEVFTTYTAHWVLAAVFGWLFLRRRYSAWERLEVALPWKERFSLFGYSLSSRFSASLDRLLIPIFLNLENLAVFAVLAALVIAPFKMFEAAIAYTLIPGLRKSESVQDRMLLLKRELATTGVVIILSVASAIFLAPFLAQVFLQGKYLLSNDLLLAAAIVGTFRLLAKFVSSVVTALGNADDLGKLNYISWIAIPISIVGAWIGAQWGLASLIGGFAIGVFARFSLVLLVAIKVLRTGMFADSPDSIKPSERKAQAAEF